MSLDRDFDLHRVRVALARLQDRLRAANSIFRPQLPPPGEPMTQAHRAVQGRIALALIEADRAILRAQARAQGLLPPP